MEKLNFELMIASPYDREKLVVEINYKNDIPVFIEQEKVFFEAIFYYGKLEVIMFPLDDFMTILQDAKFFLAGNENEYMKLYNTNKELFESTKKAYIEDCKLVAMASTNEEKTVKILRNGLFMASLSKGNGSLNIRFYYHGKDIRIPVEALQHLLCKARELLINE